MYYTTHNNNLLLSSIRKIILAQIHSMLKHSHSQEVTKLFSHTINKVPSIELSFTNKKKLLH